MAPACGSEELAAARVAVEAGLIGVFVVGLGVVDNDFVFLGAGAANAVASNAAVPRLDSFMLYQDIQRMKVVVGDCHDSYGLRFVGSMPSGSRCVESDG